MSSVFFFFPIFPPSQSKTFLNFHDGFALLLLFARRGSPIRVRDIITFSAVYEFNLFLFLFFFRCFILTPTSVELSFEQPKGH